MTWNMNWLLAPKKLCPLQSATLTNITITNKSPSPIVVFETLLTFDWMGSYRWAQRCNTQVNPGETASLPDVPFVVELGAPPGTHNFKPGVSYHSLEAGKWIPQHSIFVSGGGFVEVGPLPSKNYKVFVSHSNASADKHFVSTCAEAFRACGLTPYFAEEDAKPGSILWEKIMREVIAADAVLVLYTRSAAKSGDVREEIGMAAALGKRIVPIVATGVKVRGTLQARGIEYIPFDGSNHHRALSQALKVLVENAANKQAVAVINGSTTKVKERKVYKKTK